MQSSIKRMAKRLWKPLRHTRVHRWAFPRRFHAFGLGLPKTGTHSLSYLLGENFRAAHEPMADTTVDRIIGAKSDPTSLDEFLVRRDRHLWLEFEASHFLCEVADRLVVLFPEAKFVVLVRDPKTWLESEINQRVRTPRTPATLHWSRWAEHKYGAAPLDRPSEEQALSEHDLPSLESMLRHYARCTNFLLDVIPAQRRLVLPTQKISEATTDIAQFLGVPPSTLAQSRTRAGHSPPRGIVLAEKVPEDYLRRLLESVASTVDRVAGESALRSL